MRPSCLLLATLLLVGSACGAESTRQDPELTQSAVIGLEIDPDAHLPLYAKLRNSLIEYVLRFAPSMDSDPLSAGGAGINPWIWADEYLDQQHFSAGTTQAMGFSWECETNQLIGFSKFYRPSSVDPALWYDAVRKRDHTRLVELSQGQSANHFVKDAHAPEFMSPRLEQQGNSWELKTNGYVESFAELVEQVSFVNYHIQCGLHLHLSFLPASEADIRPAFHFAALLADYLAFKTYASEHVGIAAILHNDKPWVQSMLDSTANFRPSMSAGSIVHIRSGDRAKFSNPLLWDFQIRLGSAELMLKGLAAFSHLMEAPSAPIRLGNIQPNTMLSGYPIDEVYPIARSERNSSLLPYSSWEFSNLRASLSVPTEQYAQQWGLWTAWANGAYQKFIEGRVGHSLSPVPWSLPLRRWESHAHLPAEAVQKLVFWRQWYIQALEELHHNPEFGYQAFPNLEAHQKQQAGLVAAQILHAWALNLDEDGVWDQF